MTSVARPAGWVLGVDSGGSGLRAALAPAGAPAQAITTASRAPVRTGARGIDAAHFLEQLVPMVRALLDRARTTGFPAPGEAPQQAPPGVVPGAAADRGGSAELAAATIGAAGMATLGEGLRAELPRELGAAFGVRRTALASDAVTAYAGALGQRPGVVVAAGTGMVALGTDLVSWRRADGWGHLLGDCGGGAWIGRAGLEAALRAHDGRTAGSPALLARLEALFGPADGLPERVYPRTDRAAVLASFAPEVASCATDDPVARRILVEAAEHIASAAAAVAPPTSVGSCEVALTGGLFLMGDALLGPLREALARRVPQARQVPAAGDPLSGAVALAAALAAHALVLPPDPRMLQVTT
ncbi:N-acetylglucosamine kinase [Streptomyces sp. NPDC059175]|uniref:N-acetylglucosamine kinase n=1 Tax=unclassified Streptomyces TaxID=2593676 RepID=UPI0036BBBAE0